MLSVGLACNTQNCYDEINILVKASWRLFSSDLDQIKRQQAGLATTQNIKSQALSTLDAGVVVLL